MSTERPSPGQLWHQANGDASRYRELMREHGYLIRRGEPGFEEAAASALPCGWSPKMERALTRIDEEALRRERIAQADTWCEKFDMPSSGCAHCRGIAEDPPEDRDKTALGAPFAARYPGTCAWCGDRIREGDTIRRDGDNGYVCEECSA